MRTKRHNLIRDLRELPAAAIPERLESRLIGSIPTKQPSRWPWRGRWTLIATTGAAAATVLLALLVWKGPHRDVGVARSADVSPQFVVERKPQRQETQSCYVLPLLPES